MALMCDQLRNSGQRSCRDGKPLACSLHEYVRKAVTITVRADPAGENKYVGFAVLFEQLLLLKRTKPGSSVVDACVEFDLK